MNNFASKKYAILSGSTLKLIAIVTMFIDHLGLFVLEKGILLPKLQILGTAAWDDSSFLKFYYIMLICRKIGRIAFPIFCFLLIEGFLHTSNRKKYALRLGAFALISEIPFDLAMTGNIFDFQQQNVFFTLLIGFLIIWIWEVLETKIFLQVIIAILGGYLAYLLNTDYDYRGIILIVILYVFRYYKVLQTVAGAVSLYWEWPAIFAFIPITLYNGKRGMNLKYFFYIFYPAHILLLYFIGNYLLTI